MDLIRDNGMEMVDFKMIDINGQFRRMAAIPTPAEFEQYYNR